MIKKQKPRQKHPLSIRAASRLRGLQTLAYITAKNRRHAKVLLLLLLIMVIGAGVWLGQAYWHMRQLREAQTVINSKYDNIKISSTSYNSDTFRGYIAYAITENQTINDTLHDLSLMYFQPCKDEAQKNNNGTSECQATFIIDFASSEYLQITYTFEAFRNKESTDTQVQTLLFNRSDGKRLYLEDLFKPDTNYTDILVKESHAQLLELFKEKYEKNATLKSEIENQANSIKNDFNAFALTEDEKVSLTFNELAKYIDTASSVTITINSNALYPLFNDQTLNTFFPKLKEQKEAERKLAEEAARQAEASRTHTRQQVAANRSNINCAAMKCIALTFDDGPSAYTNQVLDVLAARNAVATFFVLGNKVASGTATLQRAANTYNEIANHSWSHPDLTRLSDDAISTQVEQTNQAIFNATGNYPKLMRPPYAALDERVKAQIKMPIALWSVDPKDWLYRDTATVYRNAIASASPGAVIILHDIHPTTVQAVPSIVDELQRQGYILVTMSELLDINQGNISSFVGHILRRR